MFLSMQIFREYIFVPKMRVDAGCMLSIRQFGMVTPLRCAGGMVWAGYQ